MTETPFSSEYIMFEHRNELLEHLEEATLGQKSREGRQWKEAVSLSYWTTTNDCPEAKRSWRQSDWLQRWAAMAPEIWAVFNQCLLKTNNTMDHLLKTGREKHLCFNVRRIRCIKRRICRILKFSQVST